MESGSVLLQLFDREQTVPFRSLECHLVNDRRFEFSIQSPHLAHGIVRCDILNPHSNRDFDFVGEIRAVILTENWASPNKIFSVLGWGQPVCIGMRAGDEQSLEFSFRGVLENGKGEVGLI